MSRYCFGTLIVKGRVSRHPVSALRDGGKYARLERPVSRGTF